MENGSKTRVDSRKQSTVGVGRFDMVVDGGKMHAAGQNTCCREKLCV